MQTLFSSVRRVRRRFHGCAARGNFGAALVLLLLVLAPGSLKAQDMELPVSDQVSLFLKVLSFDRQRSQQSDAILVIGIAYQGGFRASVTAREEVERALKNMGDRKVRVVPIDLDRAMLDNVLQQQHVTVLYVAPLRAYSIADIAASAANAHATTMSGVPRYIEEGLIISAYLLGERPKLLVNVTAARKSGADFTSELLKLAQVVR